MASSYLNHDQLRFIAMFRRFRMDPIFKFDGLAVFFTVGAEVDCLIDSSLEVVDEPPHAFFGDNFLLCSMG